MRRLTLAVTPAALMAGLTPAMAFPVLGRIGQQLHLGTATVTWVLTASFLASAVATPIIGRLADLYGRRRVLLLTITTVVAGSVLAATTLSFPVLILGRVLQGTVSALYPLVVSTLQHQLSGRRMTSSVSFISATLGVGGGVGLAVAGLLGNGSDYRTIFWFPVALGVLALASVALGAPADDARKPGRVDLLGCALLSAGLVLVLLPLSQGARWGFASPIVLVCFGAGACLLVAFDLVERRVREPMVPLQLLHHHPMLVTNVFSALVGVFTFIPLVVVPILVQKDPSIVGDGAPATPLITALVFLLPGNLFGIVGAPIGTRVARRRGPRVAFALVGAIALAGSLGSVFSPGVPAMLIVGMFLTTTALYVNYGALPALLVAHVDRADLGVANGMNSLGRWVGSALATALASLVLTTEAHGEPLGPSAFRWAFCIGAVASVGVIVLAQLGLASERSADAAVAADVVASPLPVAPGVVGAFVDPHVPIVEAPPDGHRQGVAPTGVTRMSSEKET